MQPLPFLGSCEVCQKVLLNYRSLAGHLRHNKDPQHVALGERWHQWKSVYRAQLRCRKCGDLFEVLDRSLKDKKRCPKCEVLRQELGKRGYEGTQLPPKVDSRRRMTETNSKAQWDGLEHRSVHWIPGDDLYLEVLKSHANKEWVKQTTKRLGITYKVYRAICAHGLGPDYDRLVFERRVDTILENLEKCHTASGLEEKFSLQIQEVGISLVARNTWITMLVDGRKVKREADLKIQVRPDHKMVILCDGEAFHGPKATVFNQDPTTKIASDRATALAFFDLGYSVIRYSESEINSGAALAHLCKTLIDLKPETKVYRNWCPNERRHQVSKGSNHGPLESHPLGASQDLRSLR